MRWLPCLLFIFLFSCGDDKNSPDVSAIPVNLSVQRFDIDLFSIDTNHLETSLATLKQKYPAFINDFLYNILALPPQKDSMIPMLKFFLRQYKQVNDTAQGRFKNMLPVRNELHLGLQFLKHYFPAYKAPEKLITFTGPIDGYGNVLTGSGFAVGLQLYLGKDFPLYRTEMVSNTYPAYQSRRFEPQYIASNCLKNIISDMYPESNRSITLSEVMVDQGKRLYVLDHLLPNTADSIKTGYTTLQLQGAYDHEAMIWNFFVQNNLLYVSDPFVIRDYINDGPNTAVLGADSPGDIAMFTGWQIVKKWMKEYPENSLKQLMETDPKKIFQEAKYKPR
ncbi:MAG: gliding motility protein GldB [Chitinophagaceae bacterium]|nr:gliding motility protein GldB [Chitinophagaceae bacterium]